MRFLPLVLATIFISSNAAVASVSPPPKVGVSTAASVPPPPKPLVDAAASVSPPRKAMFATAASVSPPPKPLVDAATSVSPPPKVGVSTTASVAPPPKVGVATTAWELSPPKALFAAAASVSGDWAPIKDVDDPHVREIGEFAVSEHNRKENDVLVFSKVVSGETQVVSGLNYRLVVEAKNGVAAAVYEAMVWEKVGKGFRQLNSFKLVKYRIYGD